MKVFEKIKRMSAKAYIKYLSSFDDNLKNVNALYLSELSEDKVLYQYKENTVYPVGSIVKIMTTLVALNENIDMKDVAIIGNNPLFFTGDNSVYRNVGLAKGDGVVLEDLMMQSMSISACDSAQAIADYTSNNQDISKKMNNLSKEIGMSKCNFVDPAGYNNENLMTAKDVYIMTKYLVENYRNELDLMLVEEIEFKGKKYLTTSPEFCYNKEKILVKSIKTGFLRSAGRSISVYIKDYANNTEYILVILGANRLIYRDYFIEYLINLYIDKDFYIKV